MRSLFTNPLILGFVAVLVLVAIDPASCERYRKHGRNKHCAEGCKSGCKTRGPGKCDTQCQPKWHLQESTGKCIQGCGKHCAFCLFFRYCLQCVDGHKLEVLRHSRDIICRPAPTGRTGSSDCDPSCATEADTPTATGCKAKGAGKCDGVCKANYVLDPDSNFCEECSLYCVPAIPGSCPGAPGTCTTDCVSGYTINSATKLCAACAAGCSSCSTAGPGSCDGVCGDNFVNAGGICEPCADQCVSGCTASGAFNCDGDCASGYGPTVPGGIHQCAPCDVNCASGCNTAGAGFCDGPCAPGYVLVGVSCEQCQPPPACSGTVMCTAPGTCLSGQCSGSTTFDNTLNICV